MTEFVAWLEANHSNLRAAAEAERDWISESGFRFVKRGRTLPSGIVSFWSHSCTKPIPFKRHGNATTIQPQL